MPDNADLLQAIIENQRLDRVDRLQYQKESSIKFLKLAAEFSDYKNKQEPINNRILSLLNNDKDSSRKGFIDQVDANTKDIAVMKTVDKIRVGQSKIISIVAGAIGGVIIFLIKLFV